MSRSSLQDTRSTDPDGKTRRLKMKMPIFASRVRTLGPGSLSSFLKGALDVIYVALFAITALVIVFFIAAIFLPIAEYDLTVTTRDGGVQQPLTQALLLFGFGAVAAWSAGFLLIVRHLRIIFRTLTEGDPFRPRNVGRLRQIGLILVTVTVGVWIAQGIVASRLAPGVMDPQGIGDLLTPLFSVMIIFVLAEVFREGARLRRDSELTI